jgi:hypothetical protein
MVFLVILFIFLTAQGYSQEIFLKRALRFDNPANTAGEGFLTFRGAVEHPAGQGLPEYSELIAIPVGQSVSGIDVLYPELESYSGDPAAFVLAENLPDSLGLSYTIEYMQKKPFVQINLIPFRKDEGNGRLLRLRSFVIRLRTSPLLDAAAGVRKTHSEQSSVLAAGSWYKISVPSAGIYKLSWEQINSMAVGDPAKVRIFGFGGNVLPEDCRKGEKDDLAPIQIYMNKGADGVFSEGDYILFYSKGSVKWFYDEVSGMFRQQMNPYSDRSYYYITTGENPDLPVSDNTEGSVAAKFSQSYDYRTFHEEELENVLLSGKQWFGENFSLTVQQSFSFTIPGLLTDKPVKIIADVMAKAIDTSYFQLSFNNATVTDFKVPPAQLSDYTSTFGFIAEKKCQIFPASPDFAVKIKYLKPDGSARGWLDYITVNGRAGLKMNGDYLDFRDMSTVEPSAITQFTLASATSSTVIWDVTNQNNIIRIPAVLNGSNINFTVPTDVLREFIAFNENGNFPSPVISGDDLGPVPNQNLHGPEQPDMVIIAYPAFLDQAEKLAAYRRNKDGLEIEVVTPEMVYNEFSSGTPDICAYRNYMKMLYERAGADEDRLPRYLLLFGDGTFDNKGIMENPGNYILTFQSDNSLSPTASYVSDDFFGLLDPGESMNTGLLDIGVGRLPVGSEEEASLLVSKILDYELPARMGDWRNSLCFIGDDEDGNTHMIDADAMATYVEENYPGFNINKIYLDAYKEVSTPSGQRYPDVNLAISNQVERGALIINYTGHGGIKGWAHELILDLNDIEGWNNYQRLPLFMTATCEFSRYDDHTVRSAGEKVLLNPVGGGIALLTTTRLVYSQPNRILNERFYEIVFEKDKDGNNYRLGDILEYTKNKAGNGINKRNFTLLGDPSMRLSYPEYFVYADSVNGKSVAEATDTLEALQQVKINGHIADMKGNLLSNFNGNLYPTVYDKEVLQQTLANDGGDKRTFRIRNNILYKGNSTIKDGKFNFNFIVPKDINYSFGTGRLSFYAMDSVSDAAGAYSEVIIGGTDADAEGDNEGPDLEVYMNSSSFRAGGITDENPSLYLEISDEHGVNTTGNGIGHDITAVLDDDQQNSFYLNGYYRAFLDNFHGGTVTYPFSGLEPGHHTVSVRVWDIYNNSATGSTDFVVVKSDNLILRDLLNYPNPFRDYTYISFAHNRAGTDLDITVDIFDLKGKLVSSIKAKEENTGFRSQNIYWDGTGAEEGQSVYIYRIRVKTSDGEEAEKSGKLIFTK